MAQHTDVAKPIQRYTRTDFTALRFLLNKLPMERIAGTVYGESGMRQLGLRTLADLEQHLETMLDHLVKRASLANPYLSKQLADAHQTRRWSQVAIDYLVQAADQDDSQPRLEDPLSAWFKPIVANVLEAEGILTLAQLKELITTRGASWYRPIPRIGQGKAVVIQQWLQKQADALGPLEIPTEQVRAGLVALAPDARQQIPLVPLERISYVMAELDGSQGANRNNTFCLISARNDLEAIQAYLLRYRGREKTARAYQKELERFLLWCVAYRGVPLSGVLTDECEAYKAFIAQPDPAWVGHRAPRNSARWRPFAGLLSPSSQRYAVQALRSFFDWLVNVRYLGGNPWITVMDPAMDEKELSMDIDKALPRELWQALSAEGGILDKASTWLDDMGAEADVMPVHRQAVKGSRWQQRAQYRLARAAVLLMGMTGLRREEVAFATRRYLKPVPEQSHLAHGLWELAVRGKRSKWRTVYLPYRVVEALRAHWADREHDFDGESAMEDDMALISPIVIPGTPAAKAKHMSDDNLLLGNGFSPDGLYTLVRTTLLRLSKDMTLDLSGHERYLVAQVAPHALRHTFATQAVAKDMPLDVLQRILGHVSQNTTSIYVRAERSRSLEEVTKLFGE